MSILRNVALGVGALALTALFIAAYPAPLLA